MKTFFDNPVFPLLFIDLFLLLDFYLCHLSSLLAPCVQSLILNYNWAVEGRVRPQSSISLNMKLSVTARGRLKQARIQYFQLNSNVAAEDMKCTLVLDILNIVPKVINVSSSSERFIQVPFSMEELEMVIVNKCRTMQWMQPRNEVVLN